MFRGNRLAESGGNLRSWLRRQNVPHLRLSATIVMLGRVGVVRMNLDRQLTGSEQKLHQQREIIRAFKPDLAYFWAEAWEPWFQALRSPNPLNEFWFKAPRFQPFQRHYTRAAMNR